MVRSSLVNRLLKTISVFNPSEGDPNMMCKCILYLARPVGSDKYLVFNQHQQSSQRAHAHKLLLLLLKVGMFLKIGIVSGEFIFSLQMSTLQIVNKSTSYTFKIVN